jgi:multiple antibiotic resistance protein
VLETFFLAFVPIFVAVDAIGMVPIFMGIAGDLSKAERDRLIFHSTLTALAVAIAFLALGRLVFQWLGITISDFLVAGGAILFIVSIRDLLSNGKSAGVPASVGVVPLAVPLIVGPAVLTTSLILLGQYGVWPTLFSIVANIVLCSTILFFSATLSRLLGEAGSSTLSKISNLLLGAIGVMLMRRGLTEIVAGFIAR